MIQEGMVLIQKGTPLPELLVPPLDYETEMDGWVTVGPPEPLAGWHTFTPDRFTDQMLAAEWDIRFVAVVKKRRVGTPTQARLLSVIDKLQDELTEKGAQGFKLCAITPERLLGVPYFSVCAHFCRIGAQKNLSMAAKSFGMHP